MQNEESSFFGGFQAINMHCLGLIKKIDHFRGLLAQGLEVAKATRLVDGTTMELKAYIKEHVTADTVESGQLDDKIKPYLPADLTVVQQHRDAAYELRKLR